MDDFIKEPDKYDFVDSNHILNYLERTMDEECENSLMDSGGSISDSTADDNRMNARLEATAGLLDNLIKTVCHGIDESTLIDKEDSVDSSVILEKDTLGGTQNKGASTKGDEGLRQLKAELKGNKNEKTLEINLASTDDETESTTTDKTLVDGEDTKSIDRSSEGGEDSKTSSSFLQEKEDSEVLVISDEEGEDSGGSGLAKEPPVTENETQSSTKNLEEGNLGASVSAKKETQEHAFHINDNMKKGLSNLAFPTKSPSFRVVYKKSTLPPLRPKANTRITIGEALEKAQDAQKIMKENSFAATAVAKAHTDPSGKYFPPASTDMQMKYASPENEASCLEWANLGAKLESAGTSDSSKKDSSSELIFEKGRSNHSPFSVENIVALEKEDQELTPGRGPKDAENSQGKPKPRAKPSVRFKLTPRMWELLRFTFDHEHFPSSVHMARLGKMMGITWSQIRNWFTNRRVDNKKAGIFPRDKLLLYCVYCKVNLKTESEQKGHLFASQHVKKILGPEYVGQSDLEAIKWKQQSPESSNAGKESVSDEEEDSESVTKNLGKRWKRSFLAKSGTNTLANESVESLRVGGVGCGKEMESESKVYALDCGMDQIPKQEVMEEASVENPLKDVDAVPVKTESEANLDSFASSLKTVNSEKLFKSNADIQSEVPSYNTVSYNGPKQSSFEGSYDYSKSCSGGSPLVRKKSHLFIEPNNILSVGIRRRHRRVENYLEESILGYQCPTCFKVFQTEWQMIKHSMTHLLFICDICAGIFPSEHILKLHIHDHLTGTYEEEKYYCQFSCKTCHSLKCECYEPLYYKPKETPKNYTRPQKAIRSKKTFLSKPYSGPNDHLRVTLGSYQKFMLQSSSTNSKQNAGNFTKLVSSGKHIPSNVSVSSLQAATQKLDDSKKNVENKQIVESGKQVQSEKMAEVSLASTQPRLSVRKDLLQENPEEGKLKPEESQVSTNLGSKSGVSGNDEKIPTSEEVTNPAIDTKEVKEIDPPRKGRGRPAGRKNVPKEKSSAYVYNDGDFYYMCEICDSSFVSKAEMQDHMFFHRFNPRSRRGEKRRLSEVRKGELKKARTDGVISETEDETVGTFGFGRFRCNECGSHFATVTDLSRHIKQAHCEELSSAQVLKCNYCGKIYRRERELRRHFKHACTNAPEELRAALLEGVTVHTLHEQGGGPHFTMVDKNSESVIKKDKPPVIPKGPYECKYCSLVTRREQEMKRHIWKSCPKTPKIIKKKCKEGFSLEELGFTSKNAEKVEVENIPSPVERPKEIESTKDVIIVSPPDADIVNTKMPTPDLQGSSPVATGLSKLPYVCAYCGIWYYREVSVAKHMKERCIIIPNSHKLILLRGGSLCDTVSNSQNSKVLTNAKGVYKMVAVDVTNNEDILSAASDSQQSSADGDQSKSLPNKANTNQIPVSVPTVPEVKEEKISKIERSVPGPTRRNINKKGTRCNRCHEIFISAEAVLAHSSVHHGPKKGFYKCKLCFERFQKYKQLREHVWEHTQETPYKCHICDTKFRLSDSIMEHLQSIHSYTQANEKNLFKWLPGRNGKYRELESAESSQHNSEETLDELDTSLDNLAEDMVVTDDLWVEKKVDVSQLIDTASSSGSVPLRDESLKKERNQELDVKNERKREIESEQLKISDKSVRSDLKKGLDRGQVGETNYNKTTTNVEQGKSEYHNKEGSNASVWIKGDAKKTEESSKKKTFGKNMDVSTRGVSSLKLKDKKSSGDDDDELLSGNLESIIETVNLTDDSFLE